VPLTEQTGNLTAICEVCSTIMHKAISAKALPRLLGVLDLTIKHAGEHLADMPPPSADDHFTQEVETDA
jgi:hypothetical protein